MRVLVTGNLGFIGSHFTRWMLANVPEAYVVGFNRKGDERNERRLADVRQTYPGRFHQVYGDLAWVESLSGLCEHTDLVVNFAAKTFVDHSLKDSEPFIHSNILGAHALMEDATRYGVKRFIQVSTDEVYGEIMQGRYWENARLEPRNPYAWSKACADLDLIWRHRTYGFPGIITRTENNFGPWQHRQKALPTFVRAALAGEPLPVYGDGSHVRCWLYVEDHCRAIWHLAEHGLPGEVYHVAGEREVANLQLAQTVLRILGKPESQIAFVPDMHIRPGHDRRYALAVEKLRATGWVPQYDLMERLEYTVRWYAEHPDWTA